MGTRPLADSMLEADTLEVAEGLRAALEWYEMTGSDGVAEDAAAPWAPGPVWPQATAKPPLSDGRSPSGPERVANRSAHGAPLARSAPSNPVTHRSATASHGDTPVAGATSATAEAEGLGGQPARTSASVGPLLDVIAAEVRGCTSCSLHSTRTQTVFSRGTGTSGLCFVGEGPGADEDAQGEPFVGKAGQLLDRMIEAMGFSRDEVYVCNVVKCRPPNNRKPTTEEMATCAPFLHRQLEVLSPTVMVALGATAVEGLLGITVGITRLRGNWKLYKGRIAVMPTFHPAYLLRSPGAKKEVWADLQAVLRQMGRPIPSRK